MSEKKSETLEDLVVDSFELVAPDGEGEYGGVFAQSDTLTGNDTCGSCTGQDTCITLCGGGGGGGGDTPLCW